MREMNSEELEGDEDDEEEDSEYPHGQRDHAVHRAARSIK